MATMPGATVIPKAYGATAVIYSAVLGWEGVVDGAPVGKDGRLYTIEPGKPKKVPYEVWRFIRDHYPYSDVVQVTETESDTGIEYDIESAKQESLAKSVDADEKCFRAYIGAMVDDYIKNKKIVPPPPDNIAAIIKRRGYDLKKFGIVPIGWEEPEKDNRIQQLEAQVKALMDQVNKPADPPKEPEKKSAK